MSIKYTEDYLVIRIKTSSAAQMHAMLLRAITAVMKHQLTYPIENKGEASDITSLADLQQTLLPDVRQLEKINDY